jgi:hypothetical protein
MRAASPFNALFSPATVKQKRPRETLLNRAAGAPNLQPPNLQIQRRFDSFVALLPRLPISQLCAACGGAF